jgi:hemerythrin superfamily protein
VIDVTSSSAKSAEDVVKALKDQHQAIKKLFVETLDASDKDQREASFFELRKLLAAHEMAEEMVIHPSARQELAAGGAIVDARLEEERKAKKHLDKIERMDIGSDEFVEALKDLQKEVRDHAEHEESEEFAKLCHELNKNELRYMTRAVEAVEAFAPTRPHPAAESAKPTFAAVSFASLLDQASDAVDQAIS